MILLVFMKFLFKNAGLFGFFVVNALMFNFGIVIVDVFILLPFKKRGFSFLFYFRTEVVHCVHAVHSIYTVVHSVHIGLHYCSLRRFTLFKLLLRRFTLFKLLLSRVPLFTLFPLFKLLLGRFTFRLFAKFTLLLNAFFSICFF